MRCPSCGAITKKRSMRCPECGAYRNKNWVDSTTTPPPEVTTVPVEVATANAGAVKTQKVLTSSPSLIAFPGTKRTAVPEWRKELGLRVREVQERRAREAALEDGQEISTALEEPAKSAPLLELIPPTEPQTVNPIVVAALQRIQRAHAQPQFSGNAAVASYVDYQEQPSIENRVAAPCTESEIFSPLEANVEVESVPAERLHNLSVVRSPAQTLEEERRSPSPRRMIRDDNDPALNYLDSVQAAVIVDARQHPSASVIRRMMGGLADLVMVVLLSLPIVALVGLTTLAWEDPRVVAFAAATVLVVGFVYFTLSTAFSGRTFGMRLLSLRIVDARTGLIPTGTQSAGRSLFFMLSLASAGIALVYTLIDRDRRAAHDRFTRTAVVRA